MKIDIHGRTLELVQGDITEQQVDAVVNAANSQLGPGSGVNGAIQSRGGPGIMADTSQRYPDGCPTGSAVISGAGDLPCRYVIHAVGPIWNGGRSGEAELLASACRRSLELAAENECRSIALPAISTGVYSYPVDQASRVALRVTIEYMQEHELPELARFVLFSPGMYGAFCAALEEQAQS
jgi:O-acetyl-ADP-ribose deacetylase (regulator of RNase III)